jgi:hypothetical protein
MEEIVYTSEVDFKETTFCFEKYHADIAYETNQHLKCLGDVSPVTTDKDGKVLTFAVFKPRINDNEESEIFKITIEKL